MKRQLLTAVATRLSLLFMSLAVCSAAAAGAGTDDAATASAYFGFRSIQMPDASARVTCLTRDHHGLVWIGTERGIYKYDGYTVYAQGDMADNDVRCATTMDGSLIAFGTKRGLIIYDYVTEQFVATPSGMPTEVNDLAYTTGTLWIASTSGLYRHDTSTNRIEAVAIDTAAIATGAIAALCTTNDSTLYVAGDSGLWRHDIAVGDFARIEPGAVRPIVALQSDTLRHCLWVGSEGAVASLPADADSLVPCTDYIGGSVRALALDADGRLLAATDDGLVVGLTTRIRHSARDASSLPSDDIRCLMAAGDAGVWIGTADGLVQLPPAHDEIFTPIWQFTGQSRGNRFTAILIDSQRRLWLGGTNGLICTTPTLDNPSATTWQHVGEPGSALASDHIVRLHETPDGDVVATTAADGWSEPTLTDSLGRQWTGLRGGICCLPDTSLADTIVYRYPGAPNCQTLDMTIVGDQLWASTTDGVWILKPDSDAPRRLRDLGHQYTSIYYDAPTGHLYLGTKDGLTYARPDELRPQRRTFHPVQVVAIDVNGDRRYVNGWQSVRFEEYLGFGATENNLTFHISDMPFDHAEPSRFLYTLTGRDKEWQTMPAGSGSITFANLSPGKYWLKVMQADADGMYVLSLDLPFKIYRPWYLSWWAFLAYFVALCGIGLLVLYLMLMRSHVRIERREKHDQLEQNREKMQLYADMSASLESPLTEVERPMEEYLAATAPDAPGRKLVEQAAAGVRNLSDKLHHLLNYNKIESEDSPLMLDEVDVGSLVRALYDEYETGAFSRNGITATYHADVDLHVLLADRIKFTSIVTALLSNAARYTPRGGTVDVSLTANDNGVVLVVADNGIGIPRRDLAHVSEPHYQASNVPISNRHAGMGLYFAKLYTQLHGGTFDVQSTVGIGTTVTIALPLR